jgi:hypothetical protein
MQLPWMSLVLYTSLFEGFRQKPDAYQANYNRSLCSCHGPQSVNREKMLSQDRKSTINLRGDALERFQRHVPVPRDYEMNGGG